MFDERERNVLRSDARRRLFFIFNAMIDAPGSFAFDFPDAAASLVTRPLYDLSFAGCEMCPSRFIAFFSSFLFTFPFK